MTIPVEVDDKSGASEESTSLNSTLDKPETPTMEVDDAVLLDSIIPKTTIEVKDESGVSMQIASLNVIPIYVDIYSNSYTLSHGWTRLNGITLYEIDKIM